MEFDSQAPAAVVLLSGGMDSCVVAALAVREYAPYFLHVDYGQRTEARERRAFTAISNRLGVRGRRRMVVRDALLRRIGGSALTDTALAVPEESLAAGAIPITYVPFRNTHLLAAAVSWAEVVGARVVLIGAVEQDGSGYPDCRPAYIAAFNRLIAEGTAAANIEVRAPLIGLSKREIVQLGLELGAPFPLSWSCYRSSELACGRCDSCRLRLRAFAQAGVSDPISYAAGAGSDAAGTVESSFDKERFPL